jgi:predicted component of type VI protein secretion system
MGKLVLHIPNGGMRDIPLDRDRITIGRRADNDVCLPYPAVSAEHAAVVTVLEDSFLEDLQSTNGTLVNGNRVVKHFLRDRDTVDVGRVQLVYLIDNDEIIAPLAQQAAMEVSGGGSSERERVPFTVASNEIDDQSAKKALGTVAVEDSVLTPVDSLLAELMDSNSDTSVAVDMPPTISVVPEPSTATSGARAPRSDATLGVYVEVMNGPNAGHIASMTKREFVLGQRGATKALIRHDEDGFSLVPVDLGSDTSVNAIRVASHGVRLAFGDTINVSGVVLRFGRREPL